MTATARALEVQSGWNPSSRVLLATGTLNGNCELYARTH